jgi:hypothetical protein
MDKLSAYQTAGEAAQNTWAGLWSNTKDVINQFLGGAFEPLFDAIKTQMKDVLDRVVTLDDKTKNIKWNPEFLDTISTIRSTINSVIAEVYRLGMGLDKVGGTLTQMKMLLYMPGTALGVESSTKRFEAAYAQNEEYRNRYLASEKSIMDMAMRESGFKPTAMFEGAEKVVTEMGQVLYYYKEITKEKDKYSTNKGKTGFTAEEISESQHALDAFTRSIKETYNSAISKAKQYLDTQRENGAYEVALVKEVKAKEDEAIWARYNSEWDAIAQSLIKEQDKQVKFAELNKWRTDQIEKNELNLNKELIAAQKQYVSVVAGAYKSIGDYSEASMQAQIKQINETYKNKAGHQQERRGRTA